LGLSDSKKAETFRLVELASQGLLSDFEGAFSKKLYFDFCAVSVVVPVSLLWLAV
jgi:hypothetical protein